MKRLFPLAFAAMLLSCTPAINNAPNTGLEGQVIRGPITPVCTENVPCDAPFSAWFSVLKDDHEVSRFQSDIHGKFAVALDPGAYTIVPDSTAPLMHPRQQREEVEVQPEGITQVTLYFDTGIR
ncbi:hypothetical protein L0337_29685 [candidate division KSB1 bacterium]|nr:hypothetical protein [candidate division KSB1 bacterium]